jgi:hypothetical protein
VRGERVLVSDGARDLSPRTEWNVFDHRLRGPTT